MYRPQAAPTRLLSLSSILSTPLILPPPHKGQDSLPPLNRATFLIAALAAYRRSGGTTITLEPAPARTHADISDLPPTRRAPHADIHPCPTHRVRRISPGGANRAAAQAHMDGHCTCLSALAHDRSQLQGLLVLHPPPDIPILGGGVPCTLLSSPSLLLRRLLNRAATAVVSKRHAYRPEGNIARAASPPPGLGSREFGVSERGVAHFGRVFCPRA
jgi:hypothetical protein